MRWLALAFVLGCRAPAPSPPPLSGRVTTTAPCDPAWWRDAAQSKQRAWLVAMAEARDHPHERDVRIADLPREPLIVIDRDRDDVRLAVVTPTTVVARWFSQRALGYAATEASAVSPAPGAPPDRAVQILRGYPLPATQTAWLAVRNGAEDLELTGFVPAAIRGTIWEASPPVAPDAHRRHLRTAIYAEPRATSAVRATATYSAELDLTPAGGGWFQVTAHSPRASVDGYCTLPVPPPQTQSHTYDFSDDVIEGDLVKPAPGPLPAATCLYDVPHGTIVGMILAPVPHRVSASDVDGWQRVELETGWGRATYYTNALPLGPPFGVE